MGEISPFATHEVIMAAGAAAPMRASVKLDRFFMALESINFDPLSSFTLFDPVSAFTRSDAVDPKVQAWADFFSAWTEVEEPAGGLKVRRLLEDRGWIEVVGSGAGRLTADGVDQLERITLGRSQLDQGFVAMWFGDELRTIYDDAIAPAIKDAGYRPMRIDRKEHNNKIDDEIIAEIRRSRFLVADMTCPVPKVAGVPTAIARGGVYYEAGFAHGLNMPVIWTAREGMAPHLHFDTRQYPHIMWRDSADLRERLKVRIAAILGYGPVSG